jgi:hypothetical protein
MKKISVGFIGRVILLICWTFSFLLPLPVKGEQPLVEMSLMAVWALVQKNAPSEKASEFEVEAVRVENERTLRENYPRLYLDVRAYSTDDPALSFMSVLGQRQIHSTDFAPESLNYPGYQFYEKGTLGVDWNLYDGGLRSARLNSQEKALVGKTYGQKNDTLDLYYQTSFLYGSVLILQKQFAQVTRLLDRTKNLQEHFRIGVKGNPLGYAGLLGIKTVANKINGVISENDSHTNSARNTLEEKAISLPKRWSPAKGSGKHSILFFVDSYLPSIKNNTEEGMSPRTEMMFAEAQASELQIEGEKAKTRPRVGLFSEGYVYGGNRDTAGSYMLGLYLQWDLLSADTYRKADQAQISANALKARAEDFRLREKIETENAYLSALALEKRISLMEENSRLLEEQFQTSGKLYSSGSINVLQLVEVINQNLDLAVNLANTEMEYLQARIALAKGLGSGIPLAVKGGNNAE